MPQAGHSMGSSQDIVALESVLQHAYGGPPGVPWARNMHQRKYCHSHMIPQSLQSSAMMPSLRREAIVDA